LVLPVTFLAACSPVLPVAILSASSQILLLTVLTAFSPVLPAALPPHCLFYSFACRHAPCLPYSTILPAIILIRSVSSNSL
jgi:hypothetical protein